MSAQHPSDFDPLGGGNWSRGVPLGCGRLRSGSWGGMVDSGSGCIRWTRRVGVGWPGVSQTGDVYPGRDLAEEHWFA